MPEISEISYKLGEGVPGSPGASVPPCLFVQSRMRRWQRNWRNWCRELKDSICTSSVMHCPELDKPFTLQTDAFGVGLGVLLLQEWNGEMKPVVFLSHRQRDVGNPWWTRSVWQWSVPLTHSDIPSRMTLISGDWSSCLCMVELDVLWQNSDKRINTLKGWLMCLKGQWKKPSWSSLKSVFFSSWSSN